MDPFGFEILSIFQTRYLNSLTTQNSFILPIAGNSADHRLPWLEIWLRIFRWLPIGALALPNFFQTHTKESKAEANRSDIPASKSYCQASFAGNYSGTVFSKHSPKNRVSKYSSKRHLTLSRFLLGGLVFSDLRFLDRKNTRICPKFPSSTAVSCEEYKTLITTVFVFIIIGFSQGESLHPGPSHARLLRDQWHFSSKRTETVIALKFARNGPWSAWARATITYIVVGSGKNAERVFPTYDIEYLSGR